MCLIPKFCLPDKQNIFSIYHTTVNDLNIEKEENKDEKNVEELEVGQTLVATLCFANRWCKNRYFIQCRPNDNLKNE